MSLSVKRNAKKARKASPSKTAKRAAKRPRPLDPNDQLAVLRASYLEDERKLLSKSLKEHDWSLTKTAAALGCRLSTLQRAARRHPELEEERTSWQVTRWGSEKRAA